MHRPGRSHEVPSAEPSHCGWGEPPEVPRTGRAGHRRGLARSGDPRRVRRRRRQQFEQRHQRRQQRGRQQGPQGLELDRLHDRPEPERFRENDRDQRRLRRGHQRQQRVLHEDPTQPVEGQGHRPRLDGAHRLDGEPAHQPGGPAVGAAARHRQVPEPEEPDPDAAERRLGPDAQVHARRGPPA